MLTGGLEVSFSIDTEKEYMQWKCPGSPRRKNFLTQSSADKGNHHILWTQKGIIEPWHEISNNLTSIDSHEPLQPPLA